MRKRREKEMKYEVITEEAEEKEKINVKSEKRQFHEKYRYG